MRKRDCDKARRRRTMVAINIHFDICAKAYNTEQPCGFVLAKVRRGSFVGYVVAIYRRNVMGGHWYRRFCAPRQISATYDDYISDPLLHRQSDLRPRDGDAQSPFDLDDYDEINTLGLPQKFVYLEREIGPLDDGIIWTREGLKPADERGDA